MLQVLATDRAGQEHILQAPLGAMLMEVLRDAGLDVEAVCGGCCACATCHIYVESALVGEPGELELALVASTGAYMETKSRLSCQIELRRELNNLQLEIAPED